MLTLRCLWFNHLNQQHRRSLFKERVFLSPDIWLIISTSFTGRQIVFFKGKQCFTEIGSGSLIFLCLALGGKTVPEMKSACVCATSLQIRAGKDRQ